MEYWAPASDYEGGPDVVRSDLGQGVSAVHAADSLDVGRTALLNENPEVVSDVPAVAP